MFTITPRAAEQIKLSAKQSDCENLPLRIAAKVAVDESIEYGMGFDEAKPVDMQFTAEGINFVDVLRDVAGEEIAHLHQRSDRRNARGLEEDQPDAELILRKGEGGRDEHQRSDPSKDKFLGHVVGLLVP